MYISEKDYIVMANPDEKARLEMIPDVDLQKSLAQEYCVINNLKLQNYIGKGRWEVVNGE